MYFKRAALTAAVVAATAVSGGCENFLEVEHPGVIDAGTIDPVADAETFSLSAQTNFFNAYDNVAVYGAYFTGEAWVDDTYAGRKEMAKRTVSDRDALLVADLYQPLALAATSNFQVLEMLEGTEREVSVSSARAALHLGFSLQLMAETFCEGVLAVGAPMTQEETAREAIRYFEQAVELATAVAQPQLAVAAQVGLARAYLQVGEYAAAAAAAASVPAEFRYDALKADDASSRTRLGNTIFYYTAARPNLVVPPYYRALVDARVPFTLLTDPASGQPVGGQGGVLAYFYQRKYAGFGVPVRLASGLEAQYLRAEAELKLGQPAYAVALTAARRAAFPAADGDAVDFVAAPGELRDLLDQKARDFYLEGKHMGDWVRNPEATPYVLPAGIGYYDVVYGGTVGTARCFPTPAVERENNPNFPR
jgi:starch-binding outer membrane protein, SusD/RagB family